MISIGKISVPESILTDMWIEDGSRRDVGTESFQPKFITAELVLLKIGSGLYQLLFLAEVLLLCLVCLVVTVQATLVPVRLMGIRPRYRRRAHGQFSVI